MFPEPIHLQNNDGIIILVLTIIVLDCNSSYIRWHCHKVANPSLVSRVKSQADIEHFSNFCDIVIHYGHIKGELPHTVVEWAQTKVGEGTIINRSYR